MTDKSLTIRFPGGETATVTEPVPSTNPKVQAARDLLAKRGPEAAERVKALADKVAEQRRTWEHEADVARKVLSQTK